MKDIVGCFMYLWWVMRTTKKTLFLIIFCFYYFVTTVAAKADVLTRTIKEESYSQCMDITDGQKVLCNCLSLKLSKLTNKQLDELKADKGQTIDLIRNKSLQDILKTCTYETLNSFFE